MMSAFNSLAKNFFMPSSEILLLNVDQKTFKSGCCEYAPLYFSPITSTGLSSSTLLFYVFLTYVWISHLPMSLSLGITNPLNIFVQKTVSII